jgi:threonine dehydrogenase-like Zn-dependent dehydrogenase
MKGVCFQCVGQVAWQSLSDPAIESDRDAIVRVTMAGLCGSDLHPFFGREPGLDPGTVMGHEFVGEVVECGPGLRNVKVGDHVCAPFSTSCGECYYCLSGLTARCVASQLFGWKSDGEGLHGGQAELVRVPLADVTLVKLEGRSPEIGLLIGDNLSTGYYCAEMAGAGPRGVHVIIGCGTVGLLCILACRARGVEPQNLLALDMQPQRLAMARRLGATPFSDPLELRESLAERSDGRGADSVMELVGLPEAQSSAFQLIRPGGTMSVIGCHCAPHFAFGPADAYNKNLTYRTGRCSARFYMEKLDALVDQFGNELVSLITHRFAPADAEKAYEIFSTRADGCVKAVLEFN